MMEGRQNRPCGFIVGRSSFRMPNAGHLALNGSARPLFFIRPFQGRGTVALAQWWWVSSPLGCVSLQDHLPPADGFLRREADLRRADRRAAPTVLQWVVGISCVPQDRICLLTRPQNPIYAGKMPDNDLLFPVGKEFFCWIRKRIPQ